MISDLPIGTRCTAVETDQAGATASKVTVEHSSDPQVAVVDSVPGEIATLVVANDFPGGGLRLETTVSDPGAPKARGPFRFSVDCSFGARQGVIKRQIMLEKGKLTTILDGFPAGAACGVTQTESGGADRTTMRKGPFTVPAGGVVTVHVANRFPDPKGDPGGVIHRKPTPGPAPVDNPDGLAHTGGGTQGQPFALGGLLLIGVGLALRSAVRRRSS